MEKKGSANPFRDSNVALLRQRQLRERVVNEYEFVLGCMRCVAFRAWARLVGRQEEHPACKNLRCLGAGVVICLERGVHDLHMAQLMPLPPHHLLLH